MPLAELTIDNLRCLQHAALRLAPGLNVITGPNGSGKTSVLESIFLLGRGRSFRTRQGDRLIRLGEPRLVVFGRTTGSSGHALGVQIGRSEGTLARIDGREVDSLVELSITFPTQVINPEIHRLIEEGPGRRRRWLDWAVFHVEPAFIGHWTRYQRALRQRNAALRLPGSDVELWNHELIREAEPLSAARGSVLERIRPYWAELSAELGDLDVQMDYYRGWGADHTLGEALIAREPRDRDRGVTSAGPHRADVQLRVAGRAAREVLSRGQQKLAGIALVLAQLELLRAELGVVPTLLLDDPEAELDARHLERFLARVERLECQRIVTSVRGAPEFLGAADRVFHVEQGRVEPR